MKTVGRSTPKGGAFSYYHFYKSRTSRIILDNLSILTKGRGRHEKSNF